MAEDDGFSSTGGGLSPASGVVIDMAATYANSEELLDDGEDDCQIVTNGLENEDNQMLEIKSNDIKRAIQNVLGIQRTDIQNGNEQVLEINGVNLENGSGHVLEFESDVNQCNGEKLLEFISNDLDGSSDQLPRIMGNSNDMNTVNADNAVIDCQIDDSLQKSHLPPFVGMEFESYDDAYAYYNFYAKEHGFGIRVKSSWTKRNSKEKRGAVLSCNCEGFKTVTDASSRRKETRTGCLAMIRLRLLESNRWRLDEVKLEHNHVFDYGRVQNSRSHKKLKGEAKRKLDSTVDVEVQTIKLYRTPVVDAVSYGRSNENETGNHIEQSKHLKCREGDMLALSEHFRILQLADPNFFYIIDLSDEGYVRNVFWISSRSRSACNYFSDVVVVDTTCLSKKFDVPLLTLTGLNHHGQPVLLGCGLHMDESWDTYVWLLRTWLTCISGRPPQTIITDLSKALRSAVSEVFPRANHRFSLPIIMQSILEKIGEVGESEIFRTLLNRTLYETIKIEDFEMAWGELIQHFAIRDHEWLQSLYEDRELWIPVYLKDTHFAGIYTSEQGECMSPFFNGHLHEKTTLSDFFNVYEFVQQKNIQKEAISDFESREFRPVLKTRCHYELQLLEVYTKEIFLKFQEEVVLMSHCCSVTQVQTNGALITYMVEERCTDGDARQAKNIEVMYDKVGIEVRCICSSFSFKGYLCCHALSVLKHNGVEEIPSQYILTRWRKDLKRLYTPHVGSNTIDITNPVQRHDHLHRRAMQVVTEGMTSQDHRMVAWQSLKESLNKVQLLSDKHV